MAFQNSRNAADLLKTAIVRRLRSDFLHERVPGITEQPLFIQDRPQPFTPEPYVYIYVVNSDEVDVTTTGTARDYFLRAQVVTKSAHNSSSETVRDAIIDEITRVLDVDTRNYINLVNDGFNIYIQNVGSITKFVDDTTRGATYFIGNIELHFRADFIGLPETNLPIQQAIYTFDGFDRPVTGTIELWDTGTITGATTYPSDNNGWDFVPPPVYQLGVGSGGTLNNNVITVGDSRATIQVIAQLSYEFDTDNDITTILTDTDSWARRRSFRYGAIRGVDSQPTFADSASGSLGLRNLSEWQTSHRFFTDIVNPTGEAITIPQQVGDYLYFITGSNVNITDVRPTSFATVPSANFIDQFDVSVVGDYRVYIRNRESTVAGDFNITIVTAT